ncbi:TPA: ogr/Delta-like zinc finger family protein [Escherichia coli]|nr:ogr/Delta-like zinc finger family protein [Escherichia coli O146]
MHPCPFCKKNASTIRTSKDASDTGTVRRKYYVCRECGARFVTFEFVDRVLSIPFNTGGQEGIELYEAMLLREKITSMDHKTSCP